MADLPVLVYTIALCFGLIIGSFLNVVIYRMPVMMQREWEAEASQILGQEPKQHDGTFNLILPDSHCPSCNHPIRAWENIPLISYIALRGKCAHCRAPISLRYPAVELAAGLLTLVVIAKFQLTPAGAGALILTYGLLAAAMIDYDHQLIPDNITLPLLWLGLIVNYFNLLVPFHDAFWGAVAGYLALWIVFHIFRLITGKEGFGYGDFKLLAMLGAWVGWQGLPAIVIISSFAGAVFGIGLIAFGRDRAKPIPFGPWLAIGGFVVLIWGEQITSSYLANF
ncbi:MAG TPA: A24 family peptidase [Pseudomonadales bacterium]|nr:A24 family peptidase [Pseudomonadales bacterium]